MIKILLIVITLIGVGVIYLGIAGSEFQEISTEIEISAPPSKVWAIVSEIDGWQEWSPIINSHKV